MRKIKTLTLVFLVTMLAGGGLIRSEANIGMSNTEASLNGFAINSVPANGWQIPFNVNNDANANQNDYYDFGWQSFIALNWPSLSGQRGAPDTSKSIGATAPDGSFIPVVWESYKDPNEVFLPNGTTQPDWNSPPPPPPSGCKGLSSDAKVLSMTSKAPTNVLSDLNMAGFPLSKADVRGPLIDQNKQYVRFEVKLNRSEFAYLQNYQYYNSVIQEAAVRANKFAIPPKGKEDYVNQLPDYARQGAVEFKASWKVLDPQKDIAERYYRRQAWLVNPDGTCQGPVLMGLVGLHILRLTPTTANTWFWATFEQVDNVQIDDKPAPVRPDGKPLTPSFNPGTPQPKQYPSGYNYEPAPIVAGKPLPPNPPVNTWRITPIPAGVKAKNDYYRTMLGNTVWRNYVMVGTMNEYTTGSEGPKKYWVPFNKQVFINTADMANVTMETYLQANNCIVCHAYGVPLGANYRRPDPNFQIFTFLLRKATPPKTSPKAKRSIKSSSKPPAKKGA